jgi:hypothetical protein
VLKERIALAILMKFEFLGCVILVLALAEACAPSVRFADRAILWRDPDDDPISIPKRRDVLERSTRIRQGIFAIDDRALSLDFGHEAENVNALDEVPDSSWFVERRARTAGARLCANRNEEGPPGIEGPDRTAPLTVVHGKVGGATRGVVVEDVRHHRFLLKFDDPRFPALETGTEAVVARLAWGAGWNVPGTAVLELRRSELRLARGASVRDAWGREHPLDEERLTALIRPLLRKDGTFRALASRWIEGTILGPFSYYGRREDDRNDRVRHENRRDLRGFGIFSAWVNNVDAIENNTLDTYVGAPGRGHVVHYQQDVGGSFGSYGGRPLDEWMGFEDYFSGSKILTAFFTLGLVPRPWSNPWLAPTRRDRIARWPELGGFSAERFDPRGWSPLWSNPAFDRQTDRDRYWGVKRIIAFSKAELRAAISAGRYRREVEDRLYEVLEARRIRLAQTYLSPVAALDHFHFDGNRLCFDDIWILAGLGGADQTRYAARERNVDLSVRGGCAALPKRFGYRVIALSVKRPGARRFGPEVRAHFIEDERGRHLVGIER